MAIKENNRTNNQSTKDLNSFSESKKDIKVSWHLFKDNWKAYASNELFALSGIIIFTIIMFIIMYFSFGVHYIESGEKPSELLIRITSSIFFLFIFAFYSSFKSCQYGLSYDIMSSGDMYTKFKNSFRYFKKFWWQYILLSFITISIRFILPPYDRIDFESHMEITHGSAILALILLIFISIIMAIWRFLFINTFPSITAQGSIKKSIKENFTIIKKYYLRIAKTWGLFILIFIIPNLLIVSALAINLNLLDSSILIRIIFLLLVLMEIFWEFISFSMMSLISTRMYNTLVTNKQQQTTQI